MLMTRKEILRQKITELYQAPSASKAEWAVWLFANHVFVVADKAEEIAERVGANPELSWAAGALHDVADAVMDRFEEGHMEESMRMARELLAESGFTHDEIAVVVDDAIRNHSCRDGHMPQTLEGKVMATADAVVHLTTDEYYPYMLKRKLETMTMDEVRANVLPKIERDYRIKIFFEEIRDEVTSAYERSKTLFADTENAAG